MEYCYSSGMTMWFLCACEDPFPLFVKRGEQISIQSFPKVNSILQCERFTKIVEEEEEKKNGKKKPATLLWSLARIYTIFFSLYWN